MRHLSILAGSVLAYLGVSQMIGNVHQYTGLGAPLSAPSSVYAGGTPATGDLYNRADGIPGTPTTQYVYFGGSWVPQYSAFGLPNAQSASGATYNDVGASGSSYIGSAYSATGAQTINLWSAPPVGAVRQIVDEGSAAGTNAITVSGNGNAINNAGVSSPTLLITTNGGHYQMRYNGSAWVVFG